MLLCSNCSPDNLKMAFRYIAISIWIWLIIQPSYPHGKKHAAKGNVFAAIAMCPMWNERSVWSEWWCTFRTCQNVCSRSRTVEAGCHPCGLARASVVQSKDDEAGMLDGHDAQRDKSLARYAPFKTCTIPEILKCGARPIYGGTLGHEFNSFGDHDG